MRRIFVCLALCSAVTASAGSVHADMLTFSDSVPLTTTDWTDTVTIPRFDPILGTLNSVQFTLNGHIEGSAFYESQDPTEQLVFLQLSANMQLQRPDSSSILTVSPVTTITELAAPFDGSIDFDGPSGSTFNNLFADVSLSATSPPPLSDLKLFTGVTPISLPVSAVGTSTGAGPGNWIFGFLLSASAEVIVVYDYKPIPEPASLAFATLGGLLMFTRRRVPGSLI